MSVLRVLYCFLTLIVACVLYLKAGGNVIPCPFVYVVHDLRTGRRCFFCVLFFVSHFL